MGVVGVVPIHRMIITACPHCFNTLKNEYPQPGGNYEVIHHTVFIEKLRSCWPLRWLMEVCIIDTVICIVED